MITEAFNVFLEDRNGNVPPRLTVQKLVNQGYNRGSAGILIRHVFPSLMAGKQFKRTLSYGDFAQLIPYLARTLRESEFLNVCKSLKLHLSYRKGQGVNTRNLRAVLYDVVFHSSGVDLGINEIDDLIGQAESDEHVSALSRDRKIELLKQITAMPANKKVRVSGFVIPRDFVAISLIKALRGPKCQFCGLEIVKRNGGHYIEAAHLVAKRDGGSELPHNIVLLCPNHHKMFDLGQSSFERIGSEVKLVFEGDSRLISLLIQ